MTKALIILIIVEAVCVSIPNLLKVVMMYYPVDIINTQVSNFIGLFFMQRLSQIIFRSLRVHELYAAHCHLWIQITGVSSAIGPFIWRGHRSTENYGSRS